MANASQAGFWPEASENNEAVLTRRVRVASNNGTAIFMGDCLSRTAAGVWGLATPGGSGVSGVAMAASFNDPNTLVRKEGKFLPVSTTYTSTAFDDHGETDQSFLYIPKDPVGVLYRAQAKAAAVPALTDLTKNASFVATAGSTTTGVSGHTLDTPGTTSTFEFAIVDFKHNVLNDMTLVNAKYIVQLNVFAVPPASAGSTGV